MLTVYCVPSVGETAHLFVCILDLTINRKRVRGGTHLGTVVALALVYRAIPPKLTNTETEVGNDISSFDYKVYEASNLGTESKLTFSVAFVFLSSTYLSEEAYQTVERESALILS